MEVGAETPPCTVVSLVRNPAKRQCAILVGIKQCPISGGQGIAGLGWGELGCVFYFLKAPPTPCELHTAELYSFYTNLSITKGVPKVAYIAFIALLWIVRNVYKSNVE